MCDDRPDVENDPALSGFDAARKPAANLVLTGFMGTGKTTVGRRVAEALGREFVDTDSVITERFGEIAEVFAHGGERRFRRIERIVAGDLALEGNLVIATGGGMLLDPGVAALLEVNGAIYCLRATPATILDRVSAQDAVRPLLSGGDPERRVRELLTERGPGYARFEQVDTDGLSIEAVTEEILRRFADRC